MKVLLLSPFYPFPEDNGSKIRTMTILQSLQGHEVHLVVVDGEREREKEGKAEDKLAGRAKDKGNKKRDGVIKGRSKISQPEREELKGAHQREALKYCSTIILIKKPTLSGGQVIKNHFSLRPLLAERFFLPEVAERIKAIISQNKIDLVISETLLMARYLQFAPGTFRVIDEHNLEFVRAERRVAATNVIAKKFYFNLIKWRLKRYELQEIAGCDLCFVCSLNDKKILESFGLKTPIKVIPNAVDVDYFQPRKKKTAQPQIVFLGTIWYEPNEDAVRYFSSEIFPELKNKFPELRFMVIGEGGHRSLGRNFPSSDIHFTGYVEDIRPHLGEATVFVVPLRMGSGTRVKILTAMAMELPVVSTSVGCEGLEIEEGKNILLADSAKDFSQKVLALLQQPHLREKISREGQKLVQEKYSREKVVTNLKKFWSELATHLPQKP